MELNSTNTLPQPGTSTPVEMRKEIDEIVDYKFPTGLEKQISWRQKSLSVPIIKLFSFSNPTLTQPTFNWSWDFNGSNDSVFVTFLLNVLENVIVLFFVFKFVSCDHVEKTQDFCCRT